jgi:hypothetical protein
LGVARYHASHPPPVDDGVPLQSRDHAQRVRVVRRHIRSPVRLKGTPRGVSGRGVRFGGMLVTNVVKQEAMIGLKSAMCDWEILSDSCDWYKPGREERCPRLQMCAAHGGWDRHRRRTSRRTPRPQTQRPSHGGLADRRQGCSHGPATRGLWSCG